MCYIMVYTQVTLKERDHTEGKDLDTVFRLIPLIQVHWLTGISISHSYNRKMLK